nr:hypothetical protein [Tanacetum cinerariifolium]
MIHIPKGAKVLKDLLSHKGRLKKAAFSGQHQPYATFSLFATSIFELKPTRISIQLADQSIKYPLRVCENLLVKISKFIFSVDFVVLEMDEDDLVPIILGRTFLAIARAVVDVHEGKLSLRVRSETVTFNIKKSMRSKYSSDDYLYYANHTAKLIQEQWVDTINHDGKWIKAEEERDPKKVRAVPPVFSSVQNYRFHVSLSLTVPLHKTRCKSSIDKVDLAALGIQSKSVIRRAPKTSQPTTSPELRTLTLGS